MRDRRVLLRAVEAPQDHLRGRVVDVAGAALARLRLELGLALALTLGEGLGVEVWLGDGGGQAARGLFGARGRLLGERGDVGGEDGFGDGEVRVFFARGRAGLRARAAHGAAEGASFGGGLAAAGAGVLGLDAGGDVSGRFAFGCVGVLWCRGCVFLVFEDGVDAPDGRSTERSHYV